MWALLVDQTVKAHRGSASRTKKVTARLRISRSASNSRTWRRSRPLGRRQPIITLTPISLRLLGSTTATTPG